MDSLAEVLALREELQTERAWREELQSLTIDQAVEIVKLRETLRRIATLAPWPALPTPGAREIAEQALARNVP